MERVKYPGKAQGWQISENTSELTLSKDKRVTPEGLRSNNVNKEQRDTRSVSNPSILNTDQRGKEGIPSQNCHNGRKSTC